MKKWQEIALLSVSNLTVALIVSGVVALVLDHKAVVSSMMMIISGLYGLVYTIIHAKFIEGEH